MSSSRCWWRRSYPGPWSWPPNVRVLCDPDKLERVFDNLFRNAVHYSYGQTAIAVRLEQTGTQVAVRVENRGKTIPPEKLGQIF